MNRFRNFILYCFLGASLILLLKDICFGAQIVQSKYVVVLDYTLRNYEDTVSINTLRPGEKVLIKVHLVDPRLPHGEHEQIQVKLDTKAFLSDDKDSSINGDASIEVNGMGLTLTFPVQYVGGSSGFCFDYIYKGSLESLEKDRVEINIKQCQTQTRPDNNDGESELGDESESQGESVSESMDDSESETISESISESESLSEPLDDTSLGNGLTGGAEVTTGTVPEKLIRASQFAVSDIYYGDSSVMAGTDFDCSITVLATPGDEDIKNAIIALSLPYGLSFVEDTDRVYLGTLKAGQSYKADFRLHADENIRNTVCAMTVGLSGVSSYYALPLEKKETVQINVIPVERLVISNLQLPEKINAAYDDGSGQFDFTLSNKGYASVTDIKIFVEGDAFENNSSFMIEELKASENASISLNLVTQEEGPLTGNIHISYINNFGEAKELDEPIKVFAEYRKAEINHDIIIDPGITQETPLIPDWIWVIVTLGALLSGGLLIHKIVKILKTISV